MTDIPTRQMWRVAVALAVVAGLVTVFNVVHDYRDTGVADWGRLALAVGIPILFYGMARVFTARRD